MKRRAFLATPLLLLGSPARCADDFPEVIAGRPLQFPRDYGAHPEFRNEWWYVTGWLADASGDASGFQVTFFRNRPGVAEASASRFAPRQLLFAHAAIGDPRHGRLRHAQRAARAGFDLASAQEGTTQVWIGNWSLQLLEDSYHAKIEAPDFRLYPAAAGDRYPLRAYLRGKPPVLPPTSGIAVRSTCLNRIRPIPEEFRGGHDAPGADLYVAYLLPFYAAEFVLIKDRLGAYRIHGPTLREGGLEHVTLAHLQNTIEAYGRLRSYVDRAAKESGHDASAIARKFEAVAREANIRLHALCRKRLTALRLVLRHEDPEFQGSGLSRTFRRLTLILDVLMPRRPYLRLRTWYRRSRLFDLVHGSTE